VKRSGETTLEREELSRGDDPEPLELELDLEFQETGPESMRDEEKALAPMAEEAHAPEPVRGRTGSSTADDLVQAPPEWCRRCGARHTSGRCLGAILAAEPERHGWRVAVDTPNGRVVHGILIAPSGDHWRARIMTFPRTLWVVPGGTKTLKFVGNDPKQAEDEAIAFVREHCAKQGHSIVDDPALVAEPDPIELEQSEEADETESQRRKLRSVLIRFGPSKPDRGARTADLSEKGLFIATSEPYARGTKLRLLLEVAGARIPLRGTVMWTRTVARPGRPAGMGIQLARPPAFYLQYVRRLP
jgi:hypothetical protein